MSATKIEWCDRVWNPVTGCSPVGAGCDNCYARRMANRFRKIDDFSQLLFYPERLDQPLRWRQKNPPLRIFVDSMGDLFHEDVPDEWIGEVINTIFECQQHIFIVLTKRPDRMRRFIKDMDENHIAISALPNHHLGVSVWDQESADRFIPILLDTPATVRIVSIEPMLGPVDLSHFLFRCSACGDAPDWKDQRWRIGFRGWEHACQHQQAGYFSVEVKTGLHHVILGGETGPGARKMDLDWARSVKDQCIEARVPFFYKGAGTATLPKKDPDYMLLDGRRWEELP